MTSKLATYIYRKMNSLPGGKGANPITWFLLLFLEKLRLHFTLLGIPKVVLVVDDDDDLREIICWALRKEGHTVYSFHDPHAALEQLQSSLFVPDIVVVDFHMKGMLGPEFISEKNKIERSIVKKCPAILITAAFEELKSHHKKIRHDFIDFLPKPVDLPNLLKIVKSSLV